MDTYTALSLTSLATGGGLMALAWAFILSPVFYVAGALSVLVLLAGLTLGLIGCIERSSGLGICLAVGNGALLFLAIVLAATIVA